ncbi:ParB/RepB/Spo0J family partition protein [Nocardia sp. NPDC056064]|uniref:ParB/RepB/Spo0J family partition protein n=1 Tax=Nocardia sp. NPDC056064 TaxID=3345701 RepID=UPI0035DD1A40
MDSLDCQPTAQLGENAGSHECFSEIGVVLSKPEKIAIALLQEENSVRVEGEDPEHIARLAAVETPLPAIIVCRRSMRVIDGMHRVAAIRLRGHTEIDAMFFDGTESEAFALSVKANVSHGLPLSAADRRSVAKRMLTTNPEWSDRAIAKCAGLSAGVVASIRRGMENGGVTPRVRVGRDGRARPLDPEQGRRRAAQLLQEKPNASLREIARAAGISPTTARAVRAQFELGGSPQMDRVVRREQRSTITGDSAQPSAAALSALQRDPSLRLTESGRMLLRLLSGRSMEPREWEEMIAGIPPHQVELIARMARAYASDWSRFADRLAARKNFDVA